MKQMTFKIGQIFEGEYLPEAAAWCNEHGDRWVVPIEPTDDGVRRFQIVKAPYPTPEEIEAQELEQAKAERAAAVAAIKVEVDGMIFDGDEESQQRLTRAIQVAEITGMDSTQWVLADNTVATVTVEQAKQALAKAMLTMGELWTKPYELRL
jgi:hypothetical protein